VATRRNKNADDEKLDSAHMEHVIKMLEPVEGSKPWTKKDACAYLCISYNTTRLNSLIEKYKENKLKEASMRAEKRGKPATDGEMSYIVSSYLEGATIDSISLSLYRGSTFVRSVLDRLGVPIRQSAHSYFRPNLIPEDCIRESFKVGQLVYSARYDSLAKIISEFKPGVYNIYLLGEKWREHAYQPAWELASLEHLRKYMANV
jgi:hypothetical protein